MRHLLVLALSAMLGPGYAQARELAVAESELETVQVVEVTVLGARTAAVWLQAEQLRLPIFTGLFEAEAIERALRGVRVQRPMTHDLIGQLLDRSGQDIQRLVIDQLHNGTYMAVLELRSREDGSLGGMDVRPSDGMALAVAAGAPIRVARELLEAADAAPPPPPTRLQQILTARR